MIPPLFNVNVESDGAWNIDGSWYSKVFLTSLQPRYLWYDYNLLAELAYITEEEYNLILENFPNYITPYQIIGYIETDRTNRTNKLINFIGPLIPNQPGQQFGRTQHKSVDKAPYYYISAPGQPVHKLVYIAVEARDFLKEQDIYGVGLATTRFVGPFDIPMYGDGDSCGPGGVGTADCGPSGTDGPSDGPDTVLPAPPDFSSSGVYNGSLSAQGNMVAMQLNTGDYNVTVTRSGSSVTTTLTPYHKGYFKEYLRNPTGDIFGANTSMPALTGVMPEKYTDLPGNAVYYTDVQLSRLSGGDQWDQFYFMTAFNSAIGWVTTCNNYLAALKKAENTNLAYYDADSFQTLTTQGFNKYQVGDALTLAFNNIGKMAREITSGYFGTANAIAKVLVDLGLGYINNLAVNLYSAGVNFEDIGNEIYTPYIVDQLRQITNANDLQTIQEVIGSSIPNIANPLDFTRIDRSAGIPNDSEFDDFAAVGRDFYNRAPTLTLQEGSEIANLINNIQSNVAPSVEALTGGDTLVSQEIIDQLREYLPIGANNEPVTILNVIGTASGYQTETMREVNDGVAQLFATEYGPRIRDTFTEISRLSAQLPLSPSDLLRDDTSWINSLEQKKNEYYALINTIVADTTGNIPAIVNQINNNYDIFTSNLYYEIKNYNKANLDLSNYGDNITVFGFVQSIPGYAVDSANIATDYMLYGLTQNTQQGEVARTVLDSGKNNSFLSEASVTITNVL